MNSEVTEQGQFSPDFSRRSSRNEFMDADQPDRDDLRNALKELAQINQFLFGYTPSKHGFERLIPRGKQSLRVLDVGTGGGDVVHYLHRTFSDRKIHLDILGIDLLEPAIQFARNRYGDLPGVRFRQMDFFELESTRTFDIVHGSLFLHHLTDDEAVRFLKRSKQLATLGVVINDLHRHPFAYHFIRMVTKWCSSNPMIVHDAPLSVLKGFTRQELERLFHRAGPGKGRLTWHPGFRWEAIVSTSASSERAIHNV